MLFNLPTGDNPRAFPLMPDNHVSLFQTFPHLPVALTNLTFLHFNATLFAHEHLLACLHPSCILLERSVYRSGQVLLSSQTEPPTITLELPIHIRTQIVFTAVKHASACV